MKIFALYYKEEHKQFINEGFIPRSCKNSNLIQNPFAENLDILDIYYNEDWKNVDFIGIVSWRFFDKLGLTFDDLICQIESGIEIYSMSPKHLDSQPHPYSHTDNHVEVIGGKAVDFYSVRGMQLTCQLVDEMNILPQKIVNFDKQLHSCNYWLLSPRYFKEYVEKYLLPVISLFENCNKAKELLQYKRVHFSNANDYKIRDLSKAVDIPIIVFFMEGLFSIFLEGKNWKYLREKPIKQEIQLDDLTKLAIKYGTDKWGKHSYTPIYHKIFQELRYKNLNVFEIGVGGYGRLNEGGESLRMWKEYFPSSQIWSIDIYDKSAFIEDRINIFRGNQIDEPFLKELVQKIGVIDIIIDDGSHWNEHVIKSFQILFPLLKDGGIYIVEDTQTSYWKDHGGETHNSQNMHLSMNYFKSLTDGLNHKEYNSPGYQATYFDQNIIEIRFLHNLIIIYKGKNLEESNIIKNNIKK